MGQIKKVSVVSGRFLLLLSLAAALSMTACTSTRSGSVGASKNRKTIEEKVAKEQSVKAAPKKKASPKTVLKTAFSQVGTPYRYGGSAPETGFDCSGFVRWVYNQHEIPLPRSSSDMISAGAPVQRKDLKPGDLVFFGRRKGISHVGIYTGENKYIHSPRTGKNIQESSLDDRGRGEYYVGARRVLDEVSYTSLSEEDKSRLIAEVRQGIDSVSNNQDKPEEAAAIADVTTVAEVAAEPVVKLASVETQAEGAGGEPAEVAAESEKPVQLAAIQEEKTEKPAAVKAEIAKKADKHKVASGETLSGIALKHGVSTQALAKANNISDVNKASLQIGKVLAIPGAGAAEKAQATQTASTKKTGQYKITSGDTLIGVARKHGLTAQELAKANNIADPAKASLQIGKVLTIPAKNAAGSKSIEHKVAAGDTLSDISRKYGVSQDELAKANKLTDQQKQNLRLGQLLIVPKKLN